MQVLRHEAVLEVIIVLFMLQVVIAVSQVMWCRDLTDCLTDDEDVLSAIKGAEQRCFQVPSHVYILTVMYTYMYTYMYVCICTCNVMHVQIILYVTMCSIFSYRT